MHDPIASMGLASRGVGALFQRGKRAILTMRREVRFRDAWLHARALLLHQNHMACVDLVRRAQAMMVGFLCLTVACLVAACVGAVLANLASVAVGPALSARPPLEQFDSTLGFPGEGPVGMRTAA